ncbi:PAS domain S-box protein [Tumidithrix elongata RA019]|uniref:Circadian input-output histidine kinase CikA n=1 Tax=Tumidithrix elongata BACA0141 TaxID=2716417 RepID=A0AAW9Q135_9CYAN|nr:PAS domain S-box protein [Tumidithrix elongata RA019]
MKTTAIPLTQIDLQTAIARTPFVVAPDVALQEIIESQPDRLNGLALVVENEQVVGILTERDLLCLIVRLNAQQRSLDTIAVREVMTSPVLTMREADFTDFFGAINLMQQHRIQHLPIVDAQDRLVGLVTHESLIEAIDQLELSKLAKVSDSHDLAGDVENLNESRDREPPESLLRKYERVFSATNDGIALVDRNYVYQLVNHIYVHRHGKTAEEMLGCTIADLHGETIFQNKIRPLVDRCFTGEPQQCQTWFDYKNGGRQFIRATFHPYFELDGTLTGVVITTHNLTAIKQAETTLQNLIEGTATTTGEDFFPALVKHLTKALNVPYALVSELADDELHTLAFWANDTLQPNFSYAFAKTPCERTLQDGKFYCESLVQEQFPDALNLVELQAQSYLGIVLNDIHGNAIGNLCILSKQPIQNLQQAENILRVFAARAAAELERERSTQALEASNQELERKVEKRTTALQASEERWQLVLKGTNDGIWDWDLRTNKIFYSDRWKQMRGFNSDEIGDTPEECLSRVHPDDYDRMMMAVDDHFAGRTEFFEVEYRVRCKDASYRWILDRGKALRDRAGQPIRMSGSETDITERKRAEQALQESESRYATLANAAPVAIFRFDAPLNCTYVSDRWSEMTGRPVESALGRGWIEALHPDDRDRLVACWSGDYERVKPGDRILEHGEGRHLRPDGSINWFYVQVAPEIDTNGCAVGFIGTLTDITERKQAEARLGELNAALQNAVDGISRLDNDGCYLSVNPAYANLCGFTPQEMIGMPWSQTVHPDDIALLEAAYQEMLDTNKVEVEARGIRKDGSVFYKQVNMISAYDEVGNFTGHHCFMKDISDRKAIEAALADSESKFRRLVEGANDLIWSADKEGMLTYLSPQFKTLFGWEPSEWIGKSLIDLLHPDDRKLVATTHREDIESGKKSINPEFRHRHRDGRYIWMRASATPIINSQGEAIGAQGILSDVSDRKQIEIELAESEAKFRRLVEGGNDLIWSSDRNALFNYLSPQFKTLFGFEPDEWIGRSCIDLVHPEDFELKFGEYLETVRSGQKYNNLEFRHRHHDGRYIWVSVNTTPILDSEGIAIGAQGILTNISARKQIEAQLQTANEQLMQFYAELARTVANLQRSNALLIAQQEASFDGILVIDENRQVVGYNQRLLSLWNVPETLLIDGDDRQLVPFALQQLTHPNEFVEKVEYLYEHPQEVSRDEISLLDGRTFDRYSSPIHSADEYYGRIWFFRDISDRKQAELALQQELLRRDAIFNASSDGIHILDLEGNLIEFNDRFAQMLGYTSAEMTGFNVTDWDAQWTREELSEILKDNSLNESTFETLHRRRDGSIFPVEISRRAMEWQDELVLVNISRDISERKRLEADRKLAEEALQASEAELRGLFVGMDDVVFVVDRTGTYLKIAPTNPAKLYRPPDILLGRKIQDLFSPEQANQFLSTIWQTLETQQTQECEYTLAIQDTEYWFGARCSPLTSESVIWVARDISDRKEYEQRLEQTNAELIRATRLKDEFLANMSHELRTPLNAILGLSEALQEQIFGSINERQLKSLKTIERSGNHLLELITDILDVAKIESGQFNLDCASVAVANLCQSSLTFIKQQALKKGIQLETKLPPDLPHLYVDERRIRQVLINLLNNAVKFTPEGGRITLEVTHKRQTENSPLTEGEGLGERSFLRIAIGDTGIGIAPEHIDKLFQPFIQIDSALNRKYEGTGLGLALVKRIVELHGGEVELTSQVGVGSCFTIELPCTTATSIPEIEPPPDSDAVTIPLKQETSPPILLAEDNEANVNTIVDYLEAMGYRVIVAKNGHEAIALAQAEHPALILMDIQMPEMDGLEAMQQIRRDSSLANVPIVALTALAMAEDRDRCLAAGANDYIAKPIKLKQLVVTMQQLLAVT